MNYTEWTEALAGYFFAPGTGGRPVTFFVDEDALEEISGAGSVDDLLAAVRLYLVPSDRTRNPYSNIQSVCRAWDKRKETTPFPGLPLLAVAVLAATRMAKEGDVRPTNYYVRYRQLIGIGGSGIAPGYEATFPELWRMYTRWLDDRLDGSFGRSTARKHPIYVNIGYALSQALFRESDRQRLTEFFDWLDLEEGEELETEELLTYFGVWVRRYRRVSRGCERMVEDPAYRDDLKETLREELDRWEGQVVDEQGRQVAWIVPLLQLGIRRSLRLRATCADGFPPSATYHSDDGNSYPLSEADPGWYSPVIPVTIGTLERGIALVAQDRKLLYVADAVVPFRQDPALGVWVGVRSVTPDEPHVALIRDDLVRESRSFLAVQADDEVQEQPAPDVAGWAVFGPFAISHPVLDSAPAGLERLIPSIKDRPVLRGGLPLGPYMYLTGGEPDLWVSPSDEPRDVVIGSFRSVVPESGGRIVIGALSLPAGHHEVLVGPSKIAIETLTSRGAVKPSGTGTLGWRLRRDVDFVPVGTGPTAETSVEDAAEVRIVGPVITGSHETLPEPSAPPLILKGGRRYIVLGCRPGETVNPEAPEPPRWMKAERLIPYGFEYTPPFEAMWVLQLQARVWRGRATSICRPPQPSPEEATEEGLAGWAKALLDLDVSVATGAEDLWESYRASAREVRG